METKSGKVVPAHCSKMVPILVYVTDVKAIPVTGHEGLHGCKMLIRIPHCLDSRLTDGSKVVSPTRRM
jgi:hypothetical protein